MLEKSFLRAQTAIMVPRTSDGRVLFAIPWHDHTVVGTTDTPIDAPSYEPKPLEEEIAFVLDTAGEYLSRKPTRDDILSIYVGIRPLVKAAGSDSRTADLRIHGWSDATDLHDLQVYGSDAEAIRALAASSRELAEPLHPALPYLAAEIVWAARHEMSQTVDDALARRTRALLLNARAAIAIAPRVAKLMADELGRNDAWQQAQVESFTALAQQYLPPLAEQHSHR